MSDLLDAIRAITSLLDRAGCRGTINVTLAPDDYERVKQSFMEELTPWLLPVNAGPGGAENFTVNGVTVRKGSRHL